METIGMFVMLAVAVIIYFLPLIVASLRQHPSAVAIAALDLLAGWTVLGWLAALVWSLSATVTKTTTDSPKPASSASDLYKLAELREKSLITQDEFEREKAKVI